jgi:hypothetical protein
MLSDVYVRKMKQDLAEAKAMVELKTRYEPDPDAPTSSAGEDQQP